MNAASIRPYAKAVIGFVTPGVVALVAAVQDGSPGGSSITGPEVVGIVAACVITGGAVFTVPNRRRVPVEQVPHRPDAGA